MNGYGLIVVFFSLLLANSGCNLIHRDGKQAANMKDANSNTVRFGQVYRATRDIRTNGTAIYAAAVSSGFDCIIPKGTRIVIENDPPAGARGVWAIPLNYKELEDKIVPLEFRQSDQYDMYGVGVLLELLGTQFEKEVFKEIKFDDEKIQKHWNLVVEIYEKQKNNKNI